MLLNVLLQFIDGSTQYVWMNIMKHKVEVFQTFSGMEPYVKDEQVRRSKLYDHTSGENI